VTRYLIPFAVGIMLGLGTVPMWMGTGAKAAVQTRASLIIVPAARPIARTHA
jgi:hypothetical protein